MRRIPIGMLTITLLAIVTGCENDKAMEHPLAGHYAETGAGSYRLQMAAAQEAAIIRQHTIYPYHFVSDSADLNEIGAREVEVLAIHREKNPGPVNLRRGSEPDEMYESRIQTIVSRFESFGVPRGSIQISDDVPGGDGARSTDVIIIRARGVGGGSSESGRNMSRDGGAPREAN